MEHLALRLIDIYKDHLEWAARLRGADVPERFRRAFEFASALEDQPIQQIRDFIDRTVTDMDRVPAVLRQEGDEVVRIEVNLTLTIEDDMVAELGRELKRLKR